MSCKIGVISDTHGLLRPEVVEFLNGCDFIVHAGDIGNENLLHKLQSIAPTYAVRGNTDKGHWAHKLPEKDIFEIEGRLLYLVHNIHDLDLDPAAAEFDAVLFGHTHRPKRYEKDGVLYFNPGSAGPSRFDLPATIGRISIVNSCLESEIITLLK
ncbi:MAG: metallophosphoesterase family protein [Sedimentisphaerales bacterium]|nr:metallophosphoesterase family protein [Sedimentisphaerales bacterium]